jgi:hypothetical protein
MSFLKNIFKKRTKEKGLLMAQDLGLITETERWRLEVERAQEKLADFLGKKTKRK